MIFRIVPKAFFIFLFILVKRSRIGVSSKQLKAVYLSLADRVENSVLNAAIGLLDLHKQALHIFALRGVVLGA